jgi:hypothetical protein
MYQLLSDSVAYLGYHPSRNFCQGNQVVLRFTA